MANDLSRIALLGIVVAVFGTICGGQTPSIAAAQDGNGTTNPVRILEMGCYTYAGTNSEICFIRTEAITPAPSPALPATCASNLPNLRFSTAGDSGRNTFALLHAAFLSGRRVKFNLNGCFGQQTTHATFNWFIVT